MSIHEEELLRSQRPRKAYHRKKLSRSEREKRKRKRAEKRSQLQAQAVERGHIVVFPFRDWCEMRGISVANGRRLAEAGRVKLTQLSERRLGVRSDHDREFLDSCVRNGA